MSKFPAEIWMCFILVVTYLTLSYFNTKHPHFKSRHVLSGKFSMYHCQTLYHSRSPRVDSVGLFKPLNLVWPSCCSSCKDLLFPHVCYCHNFLCVTKIDIVTYESSSRIASYSCAKSSSIPNKSCAYGPAHAQPPRACIPNTSFRTVQTKLWCRKVPRGWRTINEKMGSLFTDCELVPRRISSGMVRMWAKTILRKYINCYEMWRSQSTTIKTM